MEKKFLTVFAVFDDKTQRKLKDLQDEILSVGLVGTQTMDIPFHLSLGSFPVEMEEELKLRIKSVCSERSNFEILLEKVGSFGNKVLFIEPKINQELIDLHNLFDGNFANGFDWHPHATMFCGADEDVVKAREILNTNFKNSLKTKIVSIQMGEFFPTRMISNESLIDL